MAANAAERQPTLRILVDAQLPPALARWLSKAYDLDARHVFDEGLLRADDPVIFDAARRAGIDAVVTKDEDFVHLLERRGPPPQVVWVTAGNVRNAELRRIVLGAWPAVMTLLLAGEPLVEVTRQA